MRNSASTTRTLAIRKPHDIIHAIDDSWRAAHVLVVGDVMLDKYIWGEVERISPEAPIPIVKALRNSEQPGGAANVAMNLAALGASVTLAGVCGEDSDGYSLAAKLNAAGIRNALTTVRGRPTIAKTRILGGRQQLLRVDVESSEALPETVCDQVVGQVFSCLNSGSPRVSAVILSDYAKGMLGERVCQAVLQRAAQLQIPVLVDPKGRDYAKYRGATTLCPNLAELALATGTSQKDLDSVLAAAETMLAALGLKTIAVTLSERGITLLDGHTRRNAPARSRQVFDVSGAGDTVVAVLALCQAAGIERMAAVRLANLAAGIVVGKVGTAPVQRHELIAALSGEANAESSGKILALDQMARRVEAWRAAGDRVVFTNGCFDLLHAGHITLLEEARRRGDRLIVGLNSDSSVRALKGPTRPVNGEDQRARLLAAISAVDGVVVFAEETPLRTVLALRPDVLVKGSDYAEQEIVGAAEVLAWGGDVIRVPLLEGFSTTRMLARALA